MFNKKKNKSIEKDLNEIVVNPQAVKENDELTTNDDSANTNDQIEVTKDRIDQVNEITESEKSNAEFFSSSTPFDEGEIPEKYEDLIPEDFKKALRVINEIEKRVSLVYLGDGEMFSQLMVAFLCGGHVLIEGVPGIGKSTLAVALAKSIEVVNKRIQFTPDTTPSDITGYNMFNPADNQFYFKEGAVFSNILIADEINRTNPRVQAGLLEAMAEKQVSVEGKVYELEELFMVIATQNPIENFGTYELPEAQLDRFFMKFSVDYLGEELELDLLKKHDDMEVRRKDSQLNKITIPEILDIRRLMKKVKISEENYKYIMNIVSASRNHPNVKTGISTRSAIQMVDGCKANALINGRNYVIPDDIKAIINPMYNHKLILDDEAKFDGVNTKDILNEILSQVNVPK